MPTVRLVELETSVYRKGRVYLRKWEQLPSSGMVLWRVPFPALLGGLVSSSPNSPFWADGSTFKGFIRLEIFETCLVLCSYWASVSLLLISVLIGTLSFLPHPIQFQCCLGHVINKISFNFQVIWFILQDVWKPVLVPQSRFICAGN